jgi:ATP-binding cassette subfamily B protein
VDQPDSRRGALFGIHVLVVESNEDARQILRMLLSYFGAAVTTTGSAREALRTLRHISPDVVIADMKLGDHDAFWLMRGARKLASRAPFVAVSGQDFDERQLLQDGFEAFLRKPLDHDRLIDVVLTVVRRP